ncbi:MAG: GNAT family N-acetyltransferase [Alphaproteobacteria bacterium]
MRRRRMIYELTRDSYVISDDQDRLDLDAIHGFLTKAYWSAGVPWEVVVRAVRNSLAFGLYDPDGALVGFGRCVTDRATFAYLSDIFVLPKNRGKGLGAWLVAAMMDHPDMSGLRHMILATNDAHGLYEKVGFHSMAKPQRYMHKLDLDIYERT